jgi:hypothetical protein
MVLTAGAVLSEDHAGAGGPARIHETGFHAVRTPPGKWYVLSAESSVAAPLRGSW